MRATFAALVILLVTTAARAATGRPNVLLILADDVGYSDFGCYGSEIATPNIDRLAAQGVKFSAFRVNPACAPTRNALHTGRYPRYHGPSIPLPDDVVTIAEVFQASGYRTALSGKWDLGRYAPDRAIDRGYEEFFGLIEGCSNYFDPSIRDPDFEGGRHRVWLHNAEPISSFPDDFYATDAIADHAISMIRKSVAGDRPFFVSVCFTAAHSPLHAKGSDILKYRGRYDRGWDVIRQERIERQRGLGLLDPEWTPAGREPEVPAWKDEPLKEWSASLMEVYAAMIDCMDQNIGRLLQALEDAGVTENTIVLILSDNGGNAEQAGGDNPTNIPGPKEGYASCGAGWARVQNAPFRRYKHWAHEGGVASPLLIRGPGLPRGAIAAQDVHVMDLMPTLLEMAGISSPATRAGKPVRPMEGSSQVRVFRGDGAGAPRELYWGWKDNRAMIDGSWKLVWDQDVCRWELYNLQVDRTEMKDLAEREPGLVRAMAARWDSWSRETGAVRNLGNRMRLKPDR